MGFGFQKLLPRSWLRRNKPQIPVLVDQSHNGWPQVVPVVRRNGLVVEISIELPQRYTDSYRVAMYPQSMSIEVYGQERSLRRVLPLEKSLQGISPVITRQGSMLVIRFDRSDPQPTACSAVEKLDLQNVTSVLGCGSTVPTQPCEG
jgi:hypothetical protein